MTRHKSIASGWLPIVACCAIGTHLASEQLPGPCTPNTCEIVLSKLASLSDKGYPGILPTSAVHVVQDGSGRFLLPSSELDQIIVFDPTGAIRALIGERGQGSAQFLMITSLLPTADGSFLVYDTRKRTITTLAPNLKVQSTVPFRLRPTLVHEGGRFIVAQQIPTRELVGQPIHLVDADGTVLRSFGAETATYRLDEPLLHERLVASTPSGLIWAAAPGRYRLEQWDPLSGKRLADIAVPSKWFSESKNFRDERFRPAPIIVALWASERELWVLVRDADARWRPPNQPNVERQFEIGEYQRTYDWVLEVIDVSSKQLIATKRFDHALWGRSPSPLLVSPVIGGDGKQTELTVWTPEVKRKERNQ